MRFPLFLFGLLASLSPVIAQDCENKITLLGGDFDLMEINRVIRTPDNHFILAGQKNADAVVMKLDGCGNVIWEKTHTYGTEQSFRDIILNGSQFIAIGYCTDCRANDTGRKILIQELTTTGDKTGTSKLLGPTNLDADAYRIRPVSGNRYVVAGTRTITQGNVSGNAMFAYLLDNALNTQTLQFFGLKTLHEIAYDVVEIPGTGFVFAGKSSQTTAPVTSQMRLVGTNNNLLEIWSQEFFAVSSATEQAARAIGRLPDGDLVIAGSKLEGSQTQLFVGKVNPLNGALKSQATYGGSGDDFARDLQVISQQEILIGGLRSESGFTENPWGLLVNSSLALTHTYPIPNQGLFNSVVAFTDNGKQHYAFAGTAIGFPARGIFARTTTLPSDTEAVREADARLQLYPNPVRDVLHLNGWEWPAGTRVSLLTLDGRTLMEGAAMPTLDLGRIPAGSYLLQFRWENGRFARQIAVTD